MKLETFFEKFELFADVPNAVTKMRELILAMAVQGRIVEPYDDDAPVGELVKQLAEAKGANGSVRVGKQTPPPWGGPTSVPTSAALETYSLVRYWDDFRRAYALEEYRALLEW